MRAILASPRLPVALVFLLVLLHTAEGYCSCGQIECKTGGQCIHQQHVCDETNHCPDGSDEDSKICKWWPPRSSNCVTRPQHQRFDYAAGCYTVHQMCTDRVKAATLDRRICKTALQPKLEPQEGGFNTCSEVVDFLSLAVNSTQRKSGCPMLYTRVGNDCLSFIPAKLSWPEARQFCRSIHGVLWYLKDFAAYSALLAYMKKERLTMDYWIGGRFDLDTNAWSWSFDNSAMPLGSPYWTLKQTESCVLRGPPHTDPFSDPPKASPGSPCYRTEISPENRSLGWCAAMTHENYYFWSDEVCKEVFSPLCIYTGPKDFDID
ncbi:uncharacterized protein LOC126989443 [Eriocheir sinensis]|uniref:uncharacterized protein LOC126989443 n=1 Tax=Eriocheir sinensis TaxID=95602 RepID=UPI0021CA9526|nr:uncharacterized protein LOC126989443 [Eriocheir sinensis]